jgi:hypothetical protein
MLNKNNSITFSDAVTLREIYPDAKLKELIKLRNRGAIDEILECRTLFPDNTIAGASAILGSRQFIRWYTNNKKVATAVIVATPLFALTAFGLHGSLGLSILAQPIPSFPGTVEHVVPAFPMAVTTLAPVGLATSNVSFFSGNGVILLHIMLVGFFTLIVSSFLKFTGRGDMIPLVAFIGGAIILKEVIGLFNQIYGAIRTLINM